jgi:hypothetical protein
MQFLIVLHPYQNHKMKRLATLALLTVPLLSAAQRRSMPLNFLGYDFSLNVAKDESLCITTSNGEVAMATSMRAGWKKPGINPASSTVSTSFQIPVFFNKDTGFIPTYDYNPQKNSYIYHTVNGGKDWKIIEYKLEANIRDALYLDNGEAWLNVGNERIVYTSDYGITWQQLDSPAPREERFAAIFFNNARKGLAGFDSNKLAYTSDNGKSWQFLPTPLDQGKYKKTNRATDPDIARVAIFKNYLIVSQEEFVFYSKIDSINWICLPNYHNFYTDPENSAIYFRNYKSIITVDDNFAATGIFLTGETKLDAKCKNAKLFVVGMDSMFVINKSNKIESIAFEKDVNPTQFGFTSKGQLGFKGQDIYYKKRHDAEWQFLYTLPYPIEYNTLTALPGPVLLYTRNDDSLFYFDSSGKQIKAITKNDMVAGFLKHGIKQIIFTNEAAGCFHSSGTQVAYDNLRSSFGNPNEGKVSLRDKGNRMPEFEDEISNDDVYDFLGKLPEIFAQTPKTTPQDLGFSNEELSRLRKDILHYIDAVKNNKEFNNGFAMYRNNLDYDRLLSLVDSVNYIKPEKLHQCLLHLEELVSTSSTWKSVIFVNYKNQKLKISATYYGATPYYFPWSVDLEGYRFRTTNAAINKFLQKVYPAFIKDENKMAVLYSLVKQIY